MQLLAISTAFIHSLVQLQNFTNLSMSHVHYLPYSFRTSSPTILLKLSIATFIKGSNSSICFVEYSLDRQEESMVIYRVPCTEECLHWRRLGCHIDGRIEVALIGQSLSTRHILIIIYSSSQLIPYKHSSLTFLYYSSLV